jgi:hypothetical protein
MTRDEMMNQVRLARLASTQIELARLASTQIAQLQTCFYMFAGNLEMARVSLNLEAAREMARFTSDIDKAEELGRCGWTFPMEAPIDDCIWLVKQSTDYTTADAAFTEYYIANDWFGLRQLENKLLSCKALERWRLVLNEAIRNLDDDRLSSCIALLIPLIEGITAIKFSNAHWSNHENREHFFSSGKRNNVEWRSYKGFTDNLFKACSFKDSSHPPPSLNRHWSLHGWPILDPKLSDCLRLLQAIDTIAELE